MGTIFLVIILMQLITHTHIYIYTMHLVDLLNYVLMKFGLVVLTFRNDSMYNGIMKESHNCKKYYTQA